jgi:hypothetical protein
MHQLFSLAQLFIRLFSVYKGDVHILFDSIQVLAIIIDKRFNLLHYTNNFLRFVNKLFDLFGVALNLRRAKSFLDRQLECAPRKILKTIAL